MLLFSERNTVILLVSGFPGTQRAVFWTERRFSGGILDGAQIFGQIGNTLQVGGEAGKEALLPLERHTEWMDTLAQKVRSSLPGAEGSEELVEAMRQAILEAHARQNDKLDELISEVRMLNDKDTTVEITTNSFTRAMSRKNQRDGKTVIPVST